MQNITIIDMVKPIMKPTNPNNILSIVFISPPINQNYNDEAYRHKYQREYLVVWHINSKLVREYDKPLTRY